MKTLGYFLPLLAVALLLVAFAHPAKAQVLDAEQVIDSPYEGWVYADEQYGPLKASSSPTIEDLTVTNSLTLLGTTISNIATWFNDLFDTQLATKDTDDLAEGGTHKYYSDTLARGAISLTTTGSSGAATYNSGTGVLNIPNYATGGGSGGGTWATTTSNVSGQLINYPLNDTDIVTVGSNSTTTAKYWFNPNYPRAYLSGEVGIGTANPNGLLSTNGTYTTSNAQLIAFQGTLASSVTSNQFGFLNNPNFTPTGATVSSLTGYYNNPGLSGAGSANVSNYYVYRAIPEIVAGYPWTVNLGIGYLASNPILGSGTNPFTSYANFYSDAITNGNGTTTGTVTNYGLRVAAINADAGVGGIINSYATFISIPTGSGGGTNTNYGMRLSGTGGSGGAGTTNNWGLYADTAEMHYFASPVSFGDATVGSTYKRPSGVWIATTSVATTTSALGLRSARVAIVANNMLGGIDFWSDDTNLTAPGTRTAAIQAIANETHTASTLGTDLIFNTTSVLAYSEKMRVTGAGNVGIGTTSPSQLLSVQGSAIFSGDLSLGNLTATGTLTGSKLVVGYASTTAVSGTDTFWTGIARAARLVITGITGSFTPSIEGEVGIDTTTNQFKYFANGGVRVLAPISEQSFTVATSSAWTGTTTIPLAPAAYDQSWDTVRCFTDTGTLNISFTDGSNRTNTFNASTTVGAVTLSTNQTFTEGEKRYVDIGTPASSPSYVSCTISKTITGN